MKRVKFSEDNAAYSPPSTPSPAFSLLSLPSSSSEASTPPPAPEVAVYPRTPYALKQDPLPSDAPPDEMHIHFILAFAPYGAPAVRHNLAFNPASLFEEQATVDSFADPATHPPLPTLSIQLPNLPWLLVVYPSSPRLGYVTVADVLYALYADLRRGAHPAEYKSLAAPDAKEVDTAYFTRCRSAGPDEQRQLEKGIRKIDFLMGKTRFLGLSATLHGEDIWELNVS